MINLNKLSKKFLLCLLTICLSGFLVLSWWLVFRDQRALQAFELIYSFLGHKLTGLRSILLVYSLNVLPTLLFLLLAIITFAVYLLLLSKNFRVKTVIIFAVLLQLLTFFSYPILSTDIFSYAFSDRVATVYQQNKWLVEPKNFPEDNFALFADWQDKTNVYGYVNHLIYLPAAYLGKGDVIKTVILYKVTVLVFSLASIVVLLKLLAKESKNKQSYYLRLIFWNPLFLLEILGSGHNDIMMIFFLLLSILFWKKQSWVMAGILLAFSIQVKLISILFFGYCFFVLLRSRKFIATAQYATAFIVTNAVAFWLMGVAPQTFIQRVFYNLESYWQSLPFLTHKFLAQLPVPFSLGFILLVAVVLFIQLKNNYSPVLSYFLTLLAYLAFFTSLYWNWYMLWLFFLVPLLDNNLLKKTALILSFTSLLAYPILWLSYRFAFANPVWDFILYAWIFLPPLGFLFSNFSNLKKVNHE